MIRLFKLASVLTLLLAVHTGFAQKSKKPYVAYLFAYFTGNSGKEEAIRFALSNDGYNYKALNANEPIVLSADISATGGVRDPHILRGEDGKTFYMTVTDMNVAKFGWGPNHGMVLLKSTDLLNWKTSRINVTETFPEFKEANRVWAPQTIYDPATKKYMIYWSMRFGNGADKIYYAYANKDFTALETTPKLLFTNPEGGSCIDGDIVWKDGKFHLFYKTEGSGNGIKKSTATNVTGPYEQQSKEYLQQTKDPVEGSGVFKLINSDKYILMYDVYTKGRYEFTESTDLEHFKKVDQNVTMDFKPRHGTIIPVTQKEVDALLKKWK